MRRRTAPNLKIPGRIRAGVVAFVAVALVAAPGASGQRGDARAPSLTLAWLAPTPADGATFRIAVGERLAVRVAAGGGRSAARIWASGLPAGAALATSAGARATGEVTWTPRRTQIGTHVFVVAAAVAGRQAATAPRAIFVNVVPATPPMGNDVVPIGTNGVYRWAYLLHATVARSQPRTTARVVTRLGAYTSGDFVNLVLLIARARDAKGNTWYRVRLPILPNGSTGWVSGDALTTTRAVTTYLVVFRKLFTATLYRGGHPVFRTRVGVGKPYWPTPSGDFYIREVVTDYNDPFYGPVAFGTSARSAVLTDWPGGGVVGIHGTSSPWLLPGRVSHGCVRIKNAELLRLFRLMPLGTPLAIR